MDSRYFLLRCFFALILGRFASAASSKFSSGQCVSFTVNTLRLINPCVGVVNYPFYLAQGQSLVTLQAQANEALSSSLLLQYPDFASQYIRYVCTTIYLKCEPDVNLQDVSTYNSQIYQHDLGVTYSVPFQRPCKSVCTSMVASTPTFIGVNWKINSTTCDAKFDYSYGDVVSGTPYFFDQNNSSYCYSAPLTKIGGPVETYQGSFCKGMVDTLIVPPANKLSNITVGFSVTQPPGITQMLIEKGFDRLKKRTIFLAPDCMAALKRYVCSQVLLQPETVTLAQALVYSNMQAYISPLESKYPGITNNTQFQLPSYLDQFYCTNYSQICASFLKIAPKQLQANCSKVVSGTNVHVFPTTIQAVATVDTSFGPLKFPTQPNTDAYYNATAYGYYEPDCPAGFVVPAHPDNDQVQWIQGTGCANACKSPFWTSEEWDKLTKVAVAMPIAGTIFCIIMLTYLAVTKEAYNYYLFTIHAMINMVASSQSLHVATLDGFESRYCYDNAINLQQEFGSSPCVTQGIVLAYTVLASSGCILAMGIQWILQSYKMKHIFYHPAYYVLQFAIIFLFPIPLVVYPGVHQSFGFFKLLPYCMIMQVPWAERNLSPHISGIPVLIAYVSGGLFFAGGWIARFFYPIPERHPEDDLLHTVERQCDPHVMMVFFSALILVPYIIAQFLILRFYDTFFTSFQDWAKCVFQHYDGTDESYLSVCGSHASDRPTIVLATWQTFTLMGSMILVCPMFIFFHLFSRNFDFVSLISRKNFVDVGTSTKYAGSESSRMNSISTSNKDVELVKADAAAAAAESVEAEQVVIEAESINDESVAKQQLTSAI